MCITFFTGVVHHAWSQVSIVWHKSMTDFRQRGYRPMHCSAFARAENIIMDGHLDIIAPVGFNQWLELFCQKKHGRELMLAHPWILVINQNTALVYTIWCDNTSRNGEVIVSRDTCVWNVSRV